MSDMKDRNTTNDTEKKENGFGGNPIVIDTNDAEVFLGNETKDAENNAEKVEPKLEEVKKIEDVSERQAEQLSKSIIASTTVEESQPENEVKDSKIIEMPEEMMKELESKEELPPIVEEQVQNEKQTKMEPKKRRNPFIILLNIVATLIFLFVVFETVIAFLNFNLIKQKEEPKYFVTTRKEKRADGFDYTIHDMGLFRIVRKEDNKQYEIKLLPFFLDK